MQLKNKKKSYGIVSLCFVVITLLSVIVAVIANGHIPLKTSFTEVTASSSTDTSSTAITALIQGHQGEEYFIVGKAAIEKRRALDDTLLCKIDYKTEINTLIETHSLTTKAGSLQDFYCKYITISETDRFLLIIDGIGNVFKYADFDEGLLLTDDYFLTDTNYTYREAANDGEIVYMLFTDQNSVNVLRKWNITSLNSGEMDARYIWSIEKVLDSGAYVLTTSNANIKTWSLSVEEEYIYLALSNGIYKIAKDFSDYGGDLRFFESAEKQYAQNYLEALRTQATDFGYTYNGDTTYSELETMLKESGVTIAQLSKLKREARARVANDNEWCEEYTGTNITIAAKYCTFSNYSLSKYGSNPPFGVVFDVNSEFFYLAVDNKLYSLSPDVLGTLDYADESLEQHMTTVSLDLEGKSFNSVTPLVYNEYSDCLYFSYEDIDVISIVEVKDTPKILCTFTASYNIQKQIGDRNNKTYHYLALSAATNELYVYALEPITSAHSSTFKTLRAVFIIIAIIALLIAAIAFYGYKNQHGQEKLKFIGRDLIKNKGVYFSLIPFIILICLFCYYEAIGSISFSFYEYTQAKPTKNWNNFNNYRIIICDPAFWTTVKNMLFFLVFDILFALVPPVIFAFMLSIMQSKGYSKTIRTLLFIPGILPGVATMLIWRIGIFGDTGVLNMIAKGLWGGQPIQWLHNSDISTWSLLLMGFPFVGSYLIFYGGMMNIPSSYYEAAELDGITVTKRLFKIDIPLIAAQTKYVFITTFINSVQNYSRTYMLGSDARTPVHNLYERMQAGNYGEASAYAVLIFLFLLVVMIVNFRDQKKELGGAM